MTRHSAGKDTGDNGLLSRLPDRERERIAPLLEHVALEQHFEIARSGVPVRHVYFPTDGMISVLSRMRDGNAVEVATIGREGLAGLSVLLGSPVSTIEIVVQVAGAAWRVRTRDVPELLREAPSLYPLAMRWTISLLAQVSQGSACNRLHPIEQRCARWLLQTHDRVDGDVFDLTQEFLAQMLGVTRPSVSVAASMLQKAGMIRYVRGRVSVLDREALESAACECYQVVTDDFRRLFGSLELESR